MRKNTTNDVIRNRSRISKRSSNQDLGRKISTAGVTSRKRDKYTLNGMKPNNLVLIAAQR